MTVEEKVALEALPRDLNTSVARHVWLPIRFDGDRPVIEWRDEWKIEVFD